MDSCQYQASCSIKEAFLKSITKSSVVSRVSFKVTCLETIDKQRHQVIAWMYCTLNPLCFALFLFLSDKVFYLIVRFVAEFEKVAVQMRFFTLMISDINDRQILAKQQALFGGKISQQHYEFVLKQHLWSHLESVFEKSGLLEKQTSDGQGGLTEILDI